MVALGIRVGYMRPAHPFHLPHHILVAERSPAQIAPVSAFATRDHIVNRSERKLLMSKMTV